MAEGLKDLNLSIEILLELLVQTFELDGLDGDGGFGVLVVGGESADRRFKARIRDGGRDVGGNMVRWLSSGRGERTVMGQTNLVPTHIDLSKATLSDLFIDEELAYGLPAGPSRAVRRHILSTGHDFLWTFSMTGRWSPRSR
jgi:hypothetical protein